MASRLWVLRTAVMNIERTRFQQSLHPCRISLRHCVIMLAHIVQSSVLLKLDGRQNGSLEGRLWIIYYKSQTADHRIRQAGSLCEESNVVIRDGELCTEEEALGLYSCTNKTHQFPLQRVIRLLAEPRGAPSKFRRSTWARFPTEASRIGVLCLEE